MGTVVGIILPVFAVILVGYGFGRSGALGAEGARGLGVFVYYAAIPALLFRSMAGETPPLGNSLAVLAAYFAGTLTVFAGSMIIGRTVFRLDLAEQGLMGVSAAFSNSVQLGIPIVLTAFGEAGLVTLGLIISLHSLILMSLATVVVEIGRGQGSHFLATLRKTVVAIVGNPVIASIIAGFLWHQIGLPLPDLLRRFLDFLGSAATPAALFSLGATIAGFRIAGDLQESLTVVAIKLLALPLLVWLFAGFVFHLAPLESAVATACAALPTGANAFILAQRYDLYVARAASSVMISTALSMLTLGTLLAATAPGR